jgi:hypothetical protein
VVFLLRCFDHFRSRILVYLMIHLQYMLSAKLFIDIPYFPEVQIDGFSVQNYLNVLPSTSYLADGL